MSVHFFTGKNELTPILLSQPGEPEENRCQFIFSGKKTGVSSIFSGEKRTDTNSGSLSLESRVRVPNPRSNEEEQPMLSLTRWLRQTLQTDARRMPPDLRKKSRARPGLANLGKS